MNDIPKPSRKIWFPAKTYGWGWGLPVCWQGWVVMAVWLVALVLGALVILRDAKRVPIFTLYTLGISVPLIFVCWLKGEKPEWRWGEKPRDPDAG